MKRKRLTQDVSGLLGLGGVRLRLVEQQWLKIYDTVAAKRGYAVAPVVKGICQGCHMALPPQLSNVLARMESIQTCPRCGRLIYRKELLEQPPADAARSADAAGEPKA